MSLVLVLLLSISKPADPGLASAVRFLGHAYAGYASENSKPVRFESITTPGLQKLIARDQAGHPGEVGDFDDIDWLCRCQDWTAIKVTSVLARRNGAYVSARVTFRDVGQPSRHVGFRLFNGPDGWRIADILLETSTGERWATGALREEIAGDHRRP